MSCGTLTAAAAAVAARVGPAAPNTFHIKQAPPSVTCFLFGEVLQKPEMRSVQGPTQAHIGQSPSRQLLQRCIAVTHLQSLQWWCLHCHIRRRSCPL